MTPVSRINSLLRDKSHLQLMTFKIVSLILEQKVVSRKANGNTNIPIYQGAGKRPRQCCTKGPKTQETATRGPEGPEDEQSSAFVSALDSATICFSRFSPKSRFSRPNLSTLMTTKMNKNFSRLSYLQHKHRVKKLE